MTRRRRLAEREYRCRWPSRGAFGAEREEIQLIRRNLAGRGSVHEPGDAATDPRPSPPVEARPGLHLTARDDGLVFGVLRPRGAGVVRKDAQTRADRKPGGNLLIDAFGPAQDAMLLVGATEDVPGDGLAVVSAHLAVAEVALLVPRAAVPAHGHPSRIHDSPTLFLLVTDDRGEHRERDVLRAADPHVVHDQVEEHVDACAHLGDAVQLLC